MKLNKLIQHLRHELNMTQEEFGLKTGFKQPYIAKLEQEVESCTLYTLERIAKRLNKRLIIKME